MKFKKDTINFIPKSAITPAYSHDFLTIVGGAATFILIILIASSTLITKSRLEKRLLIITQSNGIKSAEIEKINKVMQEKEKREKAKVVLQGLTSTKKLWGEHFKELSLILPKAVWIDSIKLKAEKSSIQMSLQGSANSQIDVSLFYQNLSRSINFSSVMMNYSELDNSFKPNLVKFQFATQGYSK